jgi:hypothetical protein
MFEQLRDEIEGLAIPVDAAALQEVLRLRDLLDARIHRAVAEFDAAGLWDLDGDLSMAGWLRHQAGFDQGAATRLPVRARKLAALPATSGAALAGTLSGGQVDVLLANVPLRHLERFAADEAALLPSLAVLDTDALRTAMADWRAKADAVAEQPHEVAHDSELFFSTTIDGRGELRGSFGPDLTAAVDAALRVGDPRDFELTPAERRADAFETMVRHFLDHQTDKVGGRHRPHVNVVMTAEELWEATGGRYVDTGGVPSLAEAGVLSCDTVLHRLLVEGQSAILDYGRASRLVPADLFQALVLRDRGCRFPGCNRAAGHTDAHHVVHWKDGGPTAILNTVLLCRRHHRRLHSTGYGAKLLPDGTFEVTYPDGHTESTRPIGLIAEQFRQRFDAA